MHAWVLLVALVCWSGTTHVVVLPDEAVCRHAASAVTVSLTLLEQPYMPWTLCVPVADRHVAVAAVRDCYYPG